MRDGPIQPILHHELYRHSAPLLNFLLFDFHLDFDAFRLLKFSRWYIHHYSNSTTPFALLLLPMTVTTRFSNLLVIGLYLLSILSLALRNLSSSSQIS